MDLEGKDAQVRLLFIDFSPALNTIIPQQLVQKLSSLGFNTPLCNWILDFLTNRLQSVRVEDKTLGTIKLSTDSPQGCVLTEHSLGAASPTPPHETITKYLSGFLF